MDPVGGQLGSFAANDKGAEVDLINIGPEGASELMARFFEGAGFRREGGDAMNATYGKGSTAARFLAGGFVTRSKYTVSVSPSPQGAHVSVVSAMSGASGGLLGVSKEKKSRAQMLENLNSFLRPPAP